MNVGFTVRGLQRLNCSLRFFVLVPLAVTNSTLALTLYEPTFRPLVRYRRR